MNLGRAACGAPEKRRQAVCGHGLATYSPFQEPTMCLTPSRLALPKEFTARLPNISPKSENLSTYLLYSFFLQGQKV